MPHEFRKPAKRELKAKYGISNDDFEVLTAENEPNGDWIERVADWEGVPTFLRRRGLRVLAVIFFFPLAVHTNREALSIEQHAATFAYSPFKGLPVPADRYATFPIYGVTSNTNVVVVTIGASGASGPMSMSNGSTNAQIGPRGAA